MSNVSKIVLPVLAILFFAIVIGYYIGTKPVDNISPVNSTPQKNTSVSSNNQEKLPAPTGKVDDTVDVILKEAADENSLLSEEVDNAKIAADNKEETNNLSQIYDENEF